MHHRSRNLSRVIVWFYDDHMDVGKWPKSSPTCKLIENHPGSLFLSPASWAPICLLIRRHATIRQPSLGTLRWTFWTAIGWNGRRHVLGQVRIGLGMDELSRDNVNSCPGNLLESSCLHLSSQGSMSFAKHAGGCTPARINQDLWQGHPSCRSCFWSHNFHLWTFDATREGKGTLCSKIP